LRYIYMQVAKWGNSLAVRLPARVVEALQLKAGDEVEVRASAATEREFLLARRLTKEEAVEGLRSSGWRFPPGWKFNREEAHERSK
jgi:antitoxin MazE